jgi:hypothetical protein
MRREEPRKTWSPLLALEGTDLDGYGISLGDVKQLHLSGWKGFTLLVRDRAGRVSKGPVVRGIYSVGGKDNVKPWLDISYFDEVLLSDGKSADISLDLARGSRDAKLFEALSSLIPPGGHLMVSYEDEGLVHKRTRQALSMATPPVVTPLGILLFECGCWPVKDFYLSEGGHEGPRKLWGDKIHEDGRGLMKGKLERELDKFFSRRREPQDTVEESAANAKKILKALATRPPAT